MTADEVFAEAKARGLMLSNLFQFAPDHFRANFRDEARGYNFGNAPTPQEALELALRAVPASPPAEAADDLFDDLLG